MRLCAVLAVGIGLFCATPSFADCITGGQTAIEGGRVCQAGVVSVCSAHEWLRTTLTCPLQPGGAPQPLITPMPVAAAAPAGARIHIVNARYRAGDTGTDFVFALRALCDGKAICALTGDTGLLQADPAPRLRGTFNVIYACSTGFETTDTKQAVFAKGTPQTLRCGE